MVASERWDGLNHHFILCPTYAMNASIMMQPGYSTNACILAKETFDWNCPETVPL